MKVFESSTARASPSSAKWSAPAHRERQLTRPSMDGLAHDPRWMLVQRIVVSPYFRRSTLLANFLLFVCDRYLSGQTSEINEKQIGFHVFGRGEGYNASDDNIVRNYARTLRKRLEEFFSAEGKDETLTLMIPRGGYVPVFVTRENEAVSAEGQKFDQDPIEQTPSLIETSGAALPAAPMDHSTKAVEGEISISITGAPTRNDFAAEDSSLESLSRQEFAKHMASEARPNEGMSRIASQNLRRLYALAAVCTILLSALSGYLGAHGASAGWFKRETPAMRMSRIFWAQLFEEKRDTFVVPADGGLVMLQSFIRDHVSLEEYANRRYLKESSIVQGIAGLTASKNAEDLSRLERKVETIGARRYTSVADLELTTRLARLPEVVPERLMIRYARDLRIDDLRSGNAILIGSCDANPWVELFQRQLNFRFSTGADFGGSGVITNQHPLSGEHVNYASEPNDPLLRTYGVIAYVPSLDGTGHTLLIEGVNMAGTQAAGDFLLDPVGMQPVLERAKGPNGTIGSFEILIETDSIAASSSRPHVISERIGLL
jgi:hypothetical protein